MALCSKHRHVLSIACTALFTQSPTQLSEVDVTLDAAEEQHTGGQTVCVTQPISRGDCLLGQDLPGLRIKPGKCSEATSKTLEGSKALTTAARDDNADTTSSR